MKRPSLSIALAAAALALSLPAAAQKVTEVNFYYPVAVGGPVTKTIDQMAADFGKENPDIKVNPIYSGTYQESIVKALTAEQERQAAAARGAAVDRHVLADRRGRDRADRRHRQVAPTTGSGSTASTRASC